MIYKRSSNFVIIVCSDHSPALEGGHVEERLLGERMVDEGDVVLVIVIVQLLLGLVDAGHALLVGLDVPQLYRSGDLVRLVVRHGDAVR